MKSSVIVLEDNFPRVRGALTGNMLLSAAQAGGHVIEAHAKINAGSGRPGLEIQLGALVGSINVKPAKVSRTRAEVDVGPTVLYARIHEYGGVIVPRNAPVLTWLDPETGERIFASAVHIPARPYMRPAADENKDDVLRAVYTQIKTLLIAATT